MFGSPLGRQAPTALRGARGTPSTRSHATRTPWDLSKRQILQIVIEQVGLGA